MPLAIPALPWNKVRMDLLEFQNKSYLVVVDFNSHYPGLRIVKQKHRKDEVMAPNQSSLCMLFQIKQLQTICHLAVMP